MEEIVIKMKSFGLYNPTEVECDGVKLVTQKLSISELVNLWKWYYHIAPYEEIIIECTKEMYNSLSVVGGAKSCLDIFNELGISKFNIV